MNKKEVVLNTIQLKPADRIAVALLGGGGWVLHQQGIEKVSELSALELADRLSEGYRTAGTDLWWVYPGLGNPTLKALGGRFLSHKKGGAALEKPLIEKLADADSLQIARAVENEHTQKVEKISGLLRAKEEGAVVGGNWGPLTFASLIYGPERLLRALRKDPDGVKGLLDVTKRLFLACADRFIAGGVEVVALSEPNASGDLISRSHFELFVLPVLQEIFQALRARGVLTALHVCGNTTSRLDLLAQCGADLVSLDYKADIAKAREAFDGKAAFAGNLNPVEVMKDLTPQEIQREARQCVQKA